MLRAALLLLPLLVAAAAETARHPTPAQERAQRVADTEAMHRELAAEALERKRVFAFARETLQQTSAREFFFLELPQSDGVVLRSSKPEAAWPFEGSAPSFEACLSFDTKVAGLKNEMLRRIAENDYSRAASDLLTAEEKRIYQAVNGVSWPPVTK